MASKKGPVQYKQGHSFGKIKRLNENMVNLESAMRKMNDFKSKSETQLGPIYQKHEDNEIKK